jgi:hypothetical protein
MHFLYLDAGSGSYIIQALIAGAVAILLYFKRIWLFIKSFFYKPKNDNK